MFIQHSKPSIGKEEVKAVNSVLKSGYISSGKLTRSFEERFARFIGAHFAVATNSGTSALHLALLALKIKPQDEVIIPSYVCTAVLNAVNYVGATAKVADINISDFNINAESVRGLVSRKTKAIIVPHMFGMAADMDELLKLNIPIIEDCALSLGTTYRGKKVGSFGRLSVFSFYATKMMTTAEGGMVVTTNSNLYNYVSDLKEYDHKEFYRLRYNYKMSDLAAALGLAQLSRLKEFISRRQKIAKMYNIGLRDLGIRLPYPKDYKAHTYFRYVIRTGRSSESIIKKLNQLGIEAKRPLFRPLHLYLGLNKKQYPETEEVYRTAVSLPIYPELTDSQVRFVITSVKKALHDH